MFNHTGLIRRIDDLGRLVIPKEIRRRFRIQEGDPIEIGENKEYILLKKYSIVELEDETVEKILQSFVKTTSHPIVLCSTTHAVRSIRMPMKTPEYLTMLLCENLRENNESYIGHEITDESKLKVAALEKICVGNELEGALIIPRSGNNDLITDADRECLKLCANAIAELLS